MKRGDMIMVVRPTHCCGDVSAIGRVFTCGGVNSDVSICNTCDFERRTPQAMIADYQNTCVDVDRVIVLPPFAPPELQRELLELHA